MSVVALNRLVHDLGRSISAERLAELPDVELLRRFNDGRDVAAFEAIVRRHGALVLAAARVVLRDETDVEDVFQAAFLVLWRDGRRIRSGTALGAWLFGVARRAALKAHARARRRQQVERASPGRADETSDELSWREACQLLHEEVDRLPESYRAPIVLCYLEGRPRDEAARHLGAKLDTLRGRLERGRELLKRRLTRRGVTLSTGLMAWLAGDNSQALDLPSGLVGAALRITAGPCPAAVAKLLPAATIMTKGKLIVAAVVMLAVGIVTAGHGRGEPRGLSPWSSPQPTGTSPVARLPEEKGKSGEKTVDVKVRFVDPDGKPLAGVWTHNMVAFWKAKACAEADVTITGVDPKDPREFYSQHAERQLSGVFKVTGAEKQPVELRLQRWSTITGRLVDPDDKPLAKAEMILSRVAETSDNGQTYSILYVLPEKVVTDAQGEFKATGLAPGFRHSVGYGPPGSKATRGLTTPDELKPGEQRDVGTIKWTPTPDDDPGQFTLWGRVVDPDGNAVIGAKVEAFRGSVGWRAKATTKGMLGRFALEVTGQRPPSGPDSILLVAAAPGFAPAVLELPSTRPARGVVVRLPESAPLEGRIIDPEGKPVAGAEVRVKSITAFEPGGLDRYLRAMRAERKRRPTGAASATADLSRHAELLTGLAVPTATDRDGRFRIASVGRDRIAELIVRGATIQHVELLARTQASGLIRVDQGYEDRPMSSFTVFPSPFEYTARPGRTITGTVRVKGAGKPVAGAMVSADGATDTAVTDSEGRYKLTGCPRGSNQNVIVSPSASETLFVAERRVADAEELTIDVELLPGRRLNGRLLDAKTGKPVAGSVEYVPAVGNQTLAPRRDIFLKRDESGTLYRARGTPTVVGPDGVYSVVVAPGPGLLVVRADERRYLDAYFEPNEAAPRANSPWRGDTKHLFTASEFGPRPLWQHDYRAIMPLNVDALGEVQRQDVRLQPATVVRGRFVDPDGKPLAGVWLRKMATESFGNKAAIEPEADFEITGVHPKRPLTFYAVHAGRNLAGEFTVAGTETERVEFRLQRAVTLTGRLCDTAGKPLAGYQIHASRGTRVDAQGGGQYAYHALPEAVMTDDGGSYRIAGLLPDRWHGVSAIPAGETASQPVGSLIPPQPAGARHDLGTLEFRRQTLQYR